MSDDEPDDGVQRLDGIRVEWLTLRTVPGTPFFSIDKHFAHRWDLPPFDWYGQRIQQRNAGKPDAGATATFLTTNMSDWHRWMFRDGSDQKTRLFSTRFFREPPEEPMPPGSVWSRDGWPHNWMHPDHLFDWSRLGDSYNTD